jgi:sugar (pentulose or hexulose) kinase
MSAAAVIAEGRAVLGIELGSTRIKACLIDPADGAVLAVGAHEWQNELVDGYWSYSLEAVRSGLQHAYAALAADAAATHGAAPSRLAAVGVSAMMHGYLAFDAQGELLVPFRTWRNTTTGAAAAALTELFGTAIPQRWSIAHLHQAVLDDEPHVARVRTITTLAGHVHELLGGERVLGVGDASGMFPLAADGTGYDPALLARYDTVAASALAGPLEGMLPAVLPAGRPAGTLSAAGAALLDRSGTLQPGALLCPPEGDAGTGMIATNAIAPRTGNVSVGTSIFAMVVLERALTGIHPEIDIVATPSGDPVAMVHANNGTSELAAWVGVLRRFAALAGCPVDADAAYRLLLDEAMTAAADADGVTAYPLEAGEPVLGLDAGRPLVLREPGTALTLAALVRAQLLSVFATLAVGMRVLRAEGVEVDRIQAHGGLFRTEGVAQRTLATALDAPVGVVGAAAEGGAWGMALLAAVAAEGAELARYLDDRVFAGTASSVVAPEAADLAGFATYLDRFESGLALQRAALDPRPAGALS